MSLFDDLTNALTNPPEDPMLKEIEAQRSIMASLERGEYTEKVAPEDTPIGKQLAELQKLREDFDKYRAEEAAYRAAEEHRAKVAERKGFLRGVIATLIVKILGNLFIYYWPSICVFIEGLFQKISPP